MPRPRDTDDPRDPLIALRIPPALDQRLRAHAANTGTTLSEIVRDAITNTLERDHAEPSPLSRTALAAGRIEPARETGKHRVRQAKHRMVCEHRVRVGNYCRRCDSVV